MSVSRDPRMTFLQGYLCDKYNKHFSQLLNFYLGNIKKDR